MRRLRQYARAVLLFLAPCALSSCATLVRGVVESPTVRVSKIDLRGLGLKGADLRIDLELQNPNRFGLVLQSVTYRMRINGRPFVQGAVTQETEIVAEGSQRIQLPVTLLYDDLKKVLETFDGVKPPRYVMEADVQLLVPVIGVVSVPVRDEGTVPLGTLDQILGRASSTPK